MRGSGVRTSVAALFLLQSCAANPELGILSELLARRPVCLTLDWGAGQRPSFYGRPAPDTLLLLPERGGRPGIPANADSRGNVALSPGQRDRQGGGWTWWTVGDTLVIRGWSVTEEDLGVQAVKPDGSTSAEWAGGDWGTSPKQGTVSLDNYKCSELPESAP
jgi:hypothetical protein